MPELSATVNTDVVVEFEVFCDLCGDGLCNLTRTRESRHRQMPQVVVEPCPKCLDAARREAAEEVRDEKLDRIQELEEQLAALQAQLDERT